MTFLVELALAEGHSKNTGVSKFFFFVGQGTSWEANGHQLGGHCSQEFLAETIETGDENRDDFHCMQMSLVMSMRLIFGDD